MSLTHRPPRSQPSAERMHEHFQERLARGGQPLPVHPLQDLLPRRRRFRIGRVLYPLRRALGEVLFVVFVGVLSAVAIVGPVGQGMGWI